MPSGRKPIDDLPILAAGSKVDGSVLSFREEVGWEGSAATVMAAEQMEAEGVPLQALVGLRDVTPDDGRLMYAFAVMENLLPSPIWTSRPPEEFFDRLEDLTDEEIEDEEVSFHDGEDEPEVIH